MDYRKFLGKVESAVLLPDEEPPRFSPVRARRWHDGSLVFEELEFEGEAEGTARLALEAGGTLAEVKAVPSSLRAAFGYAVLEGASRALGIRFSPIEVRGQVLSVAEGCRPAAEARLRALATERDAHVRAVEARLVALETQRRREEAAAQLQAELARMRSQPRHMEWQAQGLTRVERVLESAGARLRDTRRLGNDRLEVTFSSVSHEVLPEPRASPRGCRTLTAPG